jgi:hypothetical protein
VTSLSPSNPVRFRVRWDLEGEWDGENRLLSADRATPSRVQVPVWAGPVQDWDTDPEDANTVLDFVREAESQPWNHLVHMVSWGRPLRRDNNPPQLDPHRIPPTRDAPMGAGASPVDRPVPLPRLSPDTRRPEYLRQINPSLIVIDEVAIMSNLTIPPAGVYVADQVADGDLAELAAKVLKARKGDAFGFGYTGTLIEQCETEAELPAFIHDALLTINEQLQDEPELILDDDTSAPTAGAAEPEE